MQVLGQLDLKFIVAAVPADAGGADAANGDASDGAGTGGDLAPTTGGAGGAVRAAAARTALTGGSFALLPQQLQLLLFDQHAVDERVRLEVLQAACFGGRQLLRSGARVVGGGASALIGPRTAVAPDGLKMLLHAPGGDADDDGAADRDDSWPHPLRPYRESCALASAVLDEGSQTALPLSPAEAVALQDLGAAYVAPWGWRWREETVFCSQSPAAHAPLTGAASVAAAAANVTVHAAPPADESPHSRRFFLSAMPVLFGVPLGAAELQELLSLLAQRAVDARPPTSSQPATVKTTAFEPAADCAGRSGRSDRSGGAANTAAVCALFQAGLAPPAVHRVLAYKACRGAIMFGERLSQRDCSLALARLAVCAQPFMCAHGRPAVVPLVLLRGDGGGLG